MNISFASETRLLNNFPSVCFPLWNSIACTPAGGLVKIRALEWIISDQKPIQMSQDTLTQKQWESIYHKFWSSKRLGMRKMTLCIANRNNDNGIFYRIMRELLVQLKGVFFCKWMFHYFLLNILAGWLFMQSELQSRNSCHEMMHALSKPEKCEKVCHTILFALIWNVLFIRQAFQYQQEIKIFRLMTFPSIGK